jgi:hypothetical protein
VTESTISILSTEVLNTLCFVTWVAGGCFLTYLLAKVLWVGIGKLFGK